MFTSPYMPSLPPEDLAAAVAVVKSSTPEAIELAIAAIFDRAIQEALLQHSFDNRT